MKLLTDFHNAILENDATQISATIKSHPRLSPEQQFAVYSDGYRIRLVQAIRSDYPVLLKLLGENEFDNFARGYIEKYPPSNYNLDFYPHKFAEFVSQSCTDKFSGELAILEGTIAEVFMLPDSEPLATNSLSEISLEDFGAMTLKLRTACRLLQFSYPVSNWLTLARAEENNHQSPEFSSLRGGVADAAIQKNPKWIATPSARNDEFLAATLNYLLVIRHNNEVQRHNLSEQEFSLLQNLASGKNVSDALEVTLSENEEQSEYIINNLQGWFAGWVERGFFRV